jgi:FMN reductase
MIEELRKADGLILGSPGYHGSVSGMIKNALDYTEDMNKDERVYLQGRAVGIIATGYGWQGVVATIATLRQITHALRGYPTPLAAGINSLGDAVFDADGTVIEDKAEMQLSIVGQEVVDLARRLAS